MVKQLAANGVQTIRTSLFPGNADFIIKAYQHGIGAVAIVYPHTNSTAKKKRTWADIPLSELKPEEFTDGFKPMLDYLEAAGVRLTAIEFGNEINTSGYNGDIASPGSGRVLGIRDLNNPDDAEARAIAEGFQVYLKIMAALKGFARPFQTKQGNAHSFRRFGGLGFAGTKVLEQPTRG